MTTRSSDETLPLPPPPLWEVAAPPPNGRVEELVRALSLPRALCGILVARGIGDAEGARAFLRPLLDHLHPPEELTDARKGAVRILRAVDGGEPILVHGDYDVDGICSTALLTLWLRHLGGRVTPFVPHRTRDGYDLGPAGVEAARRAGAGLIVTCDSGISAHEAVRSAGKIGIDVVVTDHHTPGPELPPAVAVVNPARSDCSYPNPSLAGAGVAFKLCQLLGRMRGRAFEELLPYLDLVALATIADLVPLRGENRVLVRFGLRALAATQRPGLLALMAVTGKDPSSVDAGSVGFVLGPRLNAAGRIGDPMDALRLLVTEDRDEARVLAEVLEEANRERREEDARTLEEALGRLRATYDPARDFGLVVEGDGWHPGVVGIVASRVVDRLHRPAVLVAVDGDSARGSARSVPSVNLYEAVRDCAPHLRRFGGHRQAAGMDLDAGEIPAFRAAFNRAVESQLGGTAPRPVLRADGPLPLEEATEELHHFLGYMGPFGIGNPRPTFVPRGARLSGEARVVGGRHLKLRVSAPGGELDAIGFGLAERVSPADVGRGPVDILFHLRDNEYRGVRSLQARLVDLRPARGDEA